MEYVEREDPMISEGTLKHFYPDSSRNCAVAFYDWVRNSIDKDQILLNLGAGPPAARGPVRVLRGEVARVVGADIDPQVLHNPDVDEAHLIGSDGVLPFEDESFDVVLSDWVLEHVAEPHQFLSQVHRVLKEGGDFFFRTPNAHHYVALIARLSPDWFHKLVANRARGYPPGEHEPWPTYYRMNTRRVIRQQGREAGFKQIQLKMWEYEPGYMVFHWMPFLVGVAYERTVNRYEYLSDLRASILGRLVK
jgi:SAM-dependent methyltransferase